MCTFLHELLTPLIIDHPRHGIGKTTTFRVVAYAVKAESADLRAFPGPNPENSGESQANQRLERFNRQVDYFRSARDKGVMRPQLGWDYHSQRRARSGSVRDARRAGIRLAAVIAAINSNAATAYDCKSSGATL
jgi:hypothetical protein